MNEAVFISDLHLHPEMPEILEKFQKFVHWAIQHTQAVYILGDFIHAWPGDEAIDAWSETIIQSLETLHQHHIKVYFMPGNRDFLIGQTFVQQAQLTLLTDPTVITLGNENVLLSHGDRYCTKDRSHQWLRWLTRNRWFKPCFLQLPYFIRQRIVQQVREYSQHNQTKPSQNMAIILQPMLAELDRYAANALIHGHTHQAGLQVHFSFSKQKRQYTLSDWEDNCSVLCYNDSKYEFFRFL